MRCFDDKWPIDELVTRQRPNEDEEPQLDQVLAETEAYEKGLGILPVSSLITIYLTPSRNFKF